MTAAGLRAWLSPWPAPGQVALLDLVRATDPFMYALFAGVHIAAPGLAVLIVSLVTLSIWRIWLAPRIQSDEPVGQAGSLPPWPTTPEDESLSLVVGEGGSKRTLAGIIFGLGMAIEAARVLTWLF